MSTTARAALATQTTGSVHAGSDCAPENTAKRAVDEPHGRGHPLGGLSCLSTHAGLRPYAGHDSFTALHRHLLWAEIIFPRCSHGCGDETVSRTGAFGSRLTRHHIREQRLRGHTPALPANLKSNRDTTSVPHGPFKTQEAITNTTLRCNMTYPYPLRPVCVICVILCRIRANFRYFPNRTPTSP